MRKQSRDARSPVFRLMGQESLESRAGFVRELLAHQPPLS